jgi:hypothetical protein
MNAVRILTLFASVWNLLILTLVVMLCVDNNLPVPLYARVRSQRGTPLNYFGKLN